MLTRQFWYKLFPVEHWRLHYPASTLGFWMLALLIAGCDRSEQLLRKQDEASSAERLVQSAMNPRLILQRCVDRYKNLKSYEDSARFEVSYQLNGQNILDQVPMQVAWDGRRKLGLRVHELLAGPADNERWHARFSNDRLELADQVLSRSLPSQVNLEWLTSDLQVAQYLTAGPAGFPPQLDLLLSVRPFESWLHDASEQEFELSAERHACGASCWIVQLKSNLGNHRCWIDQATHLLRRLDLPVQILPETLRQDPKVSQLQVAIEFGEIRIDQTIDWSDYQDATKPADLRVGHFVPAPPAIDLRGLGQLTPAFQLRDAQGKIGYQSAPLATRKASVLVWLADHPACWIVAEQLAAAAKIIRQQDSDVGQVDFVTVWAEPEPPAGMTFQELQQKLQIPGPLVIDRAAAGRDLFQIDEAPTIILLDAKGQLQLRDVRTNPAMDLALAPLVQRVARGDDLAKELVSDHQKALNRHRTELAIAAATDYLPTHPQLPDRYSPDNVRLVELAKEPLTTPVCCLFQDRQHTAWLLQADGRLSQIDSNLRISQSMQTDWQFNHARPLTVLASPGSRYFACVSASSTGRIDLYDAVMSHSTHFQLPDNMTAVDIQWLSLTGSKTPRLAVITTGRQILLLDPDNRQQLSGNCPDEPLAIVFGQVSKEEVQGLVALKDGTIQPIQFPTKSVSSSKAVGIKSATATRPFVSKLSFTPNDGPWYGTATNDGYMTLAYGWIEDQQPGLFMLDARLQTQWHYRLPQSTEGRQQHHQIVAARWPRNGDIIWAILDSNAVVHLLKGDALWTDHCRISPDTRGIALIPVGDHLVLLSADNGHWSAHRLE